MTFFEPGFPAPKTLPTPAPSNVAPPTFPTRDAGARRAGFESGVLVAVTLVDVALPRMNLCWWAGPGSLQWAAVKELRREREMNQRQMRGKSLCSTEEEEEGGRRRKGRRRKGRRKGRRRKGRRKRTRRMRGRKRIKRRRKRRRGRGKKKRRKRKRRNTQVRKCLEVLK